MELNLLPFLDLVFAFIGILIVIFALQETARQDSGRALAIDDLAICVSEGEVTFHAGSAAEPVRYGEHEFPDLFAAMAEQGDGVRNLVFAFSAACFATRRAFEDDFARFTSLLQNQPERRRIFRLAFRPLSSAPDAVKHLLSDWRGMAPTHGD